MRCYAYRGFVIYCEDYQFVSIIDMRTGIENIRKEINFEPVVEWLYYLVDCLMSDSEKANFSYRYEYLLFDLTPIQYADFLSPDRRNKLSNKMI